jgi:hypothetical protein
VQLSAGRCLAIVRRNRGSPSAALTPAPPASRCRWTTPAPG